MLEQSVPEGLHPVEGTHAGAVHEELPPLNHAPKRHIYTSFKYLQGWGLNHFPGQPVPMLNNPFGEENCPNIQSKPPLVQLEAIFSCPMACYLGEETDPHLSTTSFQVIVESDKVSPQPPFLQAKQPQFPQLCEGVKAAPATPCTLMDHLSGRHCLGLPAPSWRHSQSWSSDRLGNGHLATGRLGNPAQPRSGQGQPSPALGSATACQEQWENHIYMIWNKKGWGLNHFPGQPVPMLNNPFSEVKFPNIQSKPPLVQLEAISSCPMACYLGEETDPHLATTSFQAVVESDKLCCPSLDTLQHLNDFLAVRGPKLNTVFEVRPYQCRVQGHNRFPSPAISTLFLIQARMPLAFLATWAHCQLTFKWLPTNTPRSFSARQLSSHSSPSL
ncbi:hypothetical protein QYF61_012491 [Mycteria americana]|uniref:Uncharacterized protein n=1 Tax=Mycteria americana TaxID=33587 RepID=A0AAN7PSQ9_MYCAM|nr:hypothetical protein QYF61_012491 [Mycteria americana]